MSDEDKQEAAPGKKGQRVTDREKAQVEPIPKKAEFFEWLEKLFDGSTQFPEKLDARVVTGSRCEKLGPLIKQIVYGPKEIKPTKEKIVALSNELLFLMQRDCDIQRKQVVYGVFVSHFSRETEYYERWLIRCQPQGVHGGDGEPREDDEEKPSAEDAFSTHVLRHQERMSGLQIATVEGLLDRMDRILERQDARIEKQDARIERQNEMLEKALSLEADREERRRWGDMKIRGVEKALDMGLGLAPPLLNQLMGKSVLPTNDTSETIALKNFFKLKENGGLLTKEQTNKAFGVYEENPPHQLIVPGVLSTDQAKLLFDVANCTIPPEHLDRLLPGGDMTVSGDQLVALQMNCGFTPEQLMPLQLIFENRMKLRMAAAK